MMLLLILSLLWPQQTGPTITATWLTSASSVEPPGGAAIVAWQDAPDGSCVYAQRPERPVVRLEPCGASQTLLLPAGGVDGAYAPAGGTVYTLRDERGQRDLASAELPRMTTALPAVAAP